MKRIVFRRFYPKILCLTKMTEREKNLFLLVIILGLLIGWYSTTGAKSQWVRLGDIFIFGPLLIYVATFIPNVWLKVIIILIGASTISYNLKNYMTEAK